MSNIVPVTGGDDDPFARFEQIDFVVSPGVGKRRDFAVEAVDIKPGLFVSCDDQAIRRGVLVAPDRRIIGGSSTNRRSFTGGLNRNRWQAKDRRRSICGASGQQDCCEKQVSVARNRIVFEGFEVYFDASNLLNIPSRRYADRSRLLYVSGIPAVRNGQYTIEYERFGRRYTGGVRFTFLLGVIRNNLESRKGD